MKSTQPRGSPARTGTRSSLVRDPGAKDFQEFGQDGTTNEKGTEKENNSGLWKMTPMEIHTRRGFPQPWKSLRLYHISTQARRRTTRLWKDSNKNRGLQEV